MSEAISRQAPHSEDAEQALLGCCFLDPGATLARAMGSGITPAAFFSPAAAMVFDELVGMLGEQLQPDPVVLAQRMRAGGRLDSIGGYAYLSQLAAHAPTTVQAGFFIDQVRDLWIRRELLKRATILTELCYDPNQDLGGALQDAANRVPEIFQARTTDRTWEGAVEEARAQAIERMKPPNEREPGAMEISWGIPDFDRAFQPIEPGELVVIGGWTSSGKSSILRQVFWSCARAGHPALIQTIETRDTQEATNLAGQIARIRPRARLHELHAEDRKELLGAYDTMKVPHFAISHEGRSLAEILARAQAFKRKHGLRLLGIDYLQLLSDVQSVRGNERPDFVIGRVTSILKGFATQENIAVFLLSGFNAEYAKDGHRAPRLTDFHGSSSIAKDASRCLLIDIPNEYKLEGVMCKQDPVADPVERPRFYTNILQAKGRDQGTSSVQMWFTRETKLFSQVARTSAQ